MVKEKEMTVDDLIFANKTYEKLHGGNKANLSQTERESWQRQAESLRASVLDHLAPVLQKVGQATNTTFLTKDELAKLKASETILKNSGLNPESFEAFKAKNTATQTQRQRAEQVVRKKQHSKA